MAITCSSTNTSNKPCGAYPLKGKDCCFMHDSSTKGKANSGRHRGGSVTKEMRIVRNLKTYTAESIKLLKEAQNAK